MNPMNDLLPDFLKVENRGKPMTAGTSKPFVGSYTILNTFKNCEHQMMRRYIKKDLPFVETPEMAWGNSVHSAFEHRVGSGKVLPENMLDWEKYAKPFDKYDVLCEQKLGMNAQGRAVGFWDGSVWFRGKADAIILDTDKAMITDWKTSKTIREDAFELETNALLLKAKYPQLKKIVGRFVWLTQNQLGQMHDLSDFASTWTEVNRLMAAIAEQQKTGEWVKRKSGLCGWCSVEDCEHYYISEKRK